MEQNTKFLCIFKIKQDFKETPYDRLSWAVSPRDAHTCSPDLRSAVAEKFAEHCPT